PSRGRPRTPSATRAERGWWALHGLQIPQVVLMEEPDVRRPGQQHREAFDASAEGEALVLRGVVADAAQRVGVDHAAAGGLDPAGARARRAARAVRLAGPFAHEAIERDLGRRLGEREVV